MQKDHNRKPVGDQGRPQVQTYHGDKFATPRDAARAPAATKQRRALDALFDKPVVTTPKTVAVVPEAQLPRVVCEAGESLRPAAPARSGANKQQELLRRVLEAQGSHAVSVAFDAYSAAGHTLPEEQEAWLQLLEHRDELRVREALVCLEQLLEGQLVRRKPVLVQRLRRLETDAEEGETREAATALRRKLG